MGASMQVVRNYIWDWVQKFNSYPSFDQLNDILDADESTIKRALEHAKKHYLLDAKEPQTNALKIKIEGVND